MLNTKLLLRHDLLKHFLGGFLIYAMTYVLLGNIIALMASILIGIGKEVVYDKLMNKGTPEFIDDLYVIIPALLMFLIF